jgi:uncharacterized protein
MHDQAAVLARYQAVLDAFVAKLEQDYYVLAAALYGSLARGEPWEKSDIDLIIILRDGKETRARPFLWAVEDGINIMAEVYPRSRFRRALDGTLQGSVLHSIRSQCRLLFSKDPSIVEWFQESSHVGARDRAYQLLRVAAEVLYPLEKAQKWFYAKHDLNYSFLWILYAVNALARVEVLLNGEAPGREVLDQALEMNPEMFAAVYPDLVAVPKRPEIIEEALKRVDGYLVARADQLFSPVLDYLSEAGDPRTATDLNAYFKKKTQTGQLSSVYEWLADHHIIDKLSSPFRLTRKSQVELDEPAYYYDTDDVSDWE